MMEDRELKVMESRVKVASRLCPDTRTAMEALFPEVFAPPTPTHGWKVGDVFVWRNMDGDEIYRIEELVGAHEVKCRCLFTRHGQLRVYHFSLPDSRFKRLEVRS